MPSQYTDITILLDRSGSMEIIKQPMQSALDEFLQEHKKVSTTRVSLVQFDSTDPQEEVYLDRPVTDAPHTELLPRGMTPLCDALCLAIDRAGQRLAAKDESLRPDQVLFVIITDGEENASHQFRREDVNRRVQQQTTQYQWQFIYLGANQDAIREAATYGINAANAMSYAPTSAGAQAVGQSISANTVAYAQQVNRGSSARLKFSTMQRAAAMAPDDDEQIPLPLVVDETTPGATK